jgi:hypothetical protein
MKLHAKESEKNKAIFGGDVVFRFDKYEIVDGDIRPTPDAAMTQYWPWDDFHTPEGKEPRRQPYSALLDLMAAHRDEDLKRPSEGLKSAVLEWCSQYGLLGMALRQDKGKEWLQPGPYINTDNLAWLEDHWREYAVPNWREYTEPLASFLELAYKFHHEIELLRVKLRGKNKHSTNAEDLGSLARGAHPMLRRDERGNLTFGWNFRSSTLAAFSVMAMLDLSNTRLLRCARKDCGKYFATKATKARFCSDRCRNTNQMRKYRRKLEQKERAK